jgi:Flp pilus assembly protein TadG
MQKLIRRFRSSRNGNIAIIFALTIVPLFGAMGAAVDYSLANAARTNMQDSLDATGIALSRIAPLTQTQLTTTGNQFFFGSLGSTPLTNVSVTITSTGSTITLDSTGTYHTTLASVLTLVGMGTTFPVSAHSVVSWGIGKVEVALVLDNTGSMSTSGKLTQLKAAAKNLISIMQSSAKNAGDAKVAIIPFDTTVNIGTGFKNLFWVDYTTMATGGFGGGGGGGFGGGGGGWGGGSSTWEGCVMDRTQNNDVLDTAPVLANLSTYYPATNCGSLVQMMPLTYNWAALNSRIDSMAANGGTNVTIGLVWGWHALSPTDVLTEGAAYNTANLTKYLILLTDGDNWQNRWVNTDGGTPTPAEVTAIDTRTALACANIKAAGIKIYAIRVINGNASLLQNCASAADMYYDVQDASQLTGVFSSIASKIANLHLSK